MYVLSSSLCDFIHFLKRAILRISDIISAPGLHFLFSFSARTSSAAFSLWNPPTYLHSTSFSCCNFALITFFSVVRVSSESSLLSLYFFIGAHFLILGFFILLLATTSLWSPSIEREGIAFTSQKSACYLSQTDQSVSAALLLAVVPFLRFSVLAKGLHNTKIVPCCKV